MGLFFGKFQRKLIGILLIISGSLCLAAATAWTLYSYHLTSTALRATGHITQLLLRHDDHGDSYYPVFNFTDRNGVRHTIHSGVGYYPPPYEVGDAVTVLYTPGAERDARLDEWSTLWGVPLILVALGIIHLSVGTLMCLWPRIAQRLCGHANDAMVKKSL